MNCFDDHLVPGWDSDLKRRIVMKNGSLTTNYYSPGYQGEVRGCDFNALLSRLNTGGKLTKHPIFVKILDLVSFFNIDSQWDDKAKANNDMRDRTDKASSAGAKKASDDEDFDEDDEEKEDFDEEDEDSDKGEDL